MIIFATVLFAYVFTLLFIQPAPESLKGSKVGFKDNFYAIRGSLLLGIFLILVFLVTSDFKFLKINPIALLLLGLSNLTELSILWLFQFMTHSIIHLDLTHLVVNLSGLGLTSLYERRVGTKRFLTVVSVSALASGLSILLYSDSAVLGGISGGICGLAVSYFIDFDNISGKDFAMALISFAIIFATFSFTNSNKTDPSMKVDHIGHILGAIGGVIYCRFHVRKRKPKLS